MADDVLEEELRPRLSVKIRGPRRKGRGARALEHAASVEGEVRQRADLPFDSQGKNRLFKPAVAERVVGADKVDLLVAHDRLEGAKRRLRRVRGEGEVMHTDVPDAPFLFHLPQKGEIGRHVAAGADHDQVEFGDLERRELLHEPRFCGDGVRLGWRASGHEARQRHQGCTP